MEDKRLFCSAFHASGGTSGSFGKEAAAQQLTSRSYLSYSQNPTVSKGDAAFNAASSHAQRDFGDPLQDLQRLLNRLLTDVEAAEAPSRTSRRQKGNQLPSRQENVRWSRHEEAALPEEVHLRWNESVNNRASNRRSRRSGADAWAEPAGTANHHQVSKLRDSSDQGSYDHWFTGQKDPADHRTSQHHSRSDYKTVGRVPPSPSWPLNSSVKSPQAFKQQNPTNMGRELEITDLRNSGRERVPAARPNSSWQTVESAWSSRLGSDTSVGGASNSRAVSNRREATLRASAEQLDYLSRHDNASTLAAAAASHQRSASDAAVRTYRTTSQDSLDYEETPRVGVGDDGQRATEAEASMSMWYRPRITREQAIAALGDASPGSFLVRDSQTYPGAYGLALRVSRLPPALQQPTADPRNGLVRHFLIEVSPGGGVRIRGCTNEPVFRSLAELVQCHSLTPMALPCCLRLPRSLKPSAGQRRTKSSLETGGRQILDESNSGRRGTTYKVLYFCTADTPSAAVNNQRNQWPHQAVSAAVGHAVGPTGGARPIECRMRVSSRGVKLSGLGRHSEFRLAYSAEDCVACELDPAGRRFSDSTGQHRESSLFGLIVKKYGYYGDQNACLVLGGNLDASAKAIIEFVNRACVQSVTRAADWTPHR